MPTLQMLQHLGLSDKESRVYLASLELGQATAQLIAIKATVNRPTTYVVIDNLMKMGLMTRHEQGKKTLFAAEPPDRLERLVERRHEELAEKEAELKSALPELKALFNLSEHKPRIKYYEGREGQLAMLHEYYVPAFRNKTLYAFTPLDILEDAVGDDVTTELVKRRVELRINLKVIYTTKQDPPPVFSDRGELREARYVPSSRYPFQGMVSIMPGWGIWMYTYKKGFTGLTIENPELADTFKYIFDLAWETAKTTDQKSTRPTASRHVSRKKR